MARKSRKMNKTLIKKVFSGGDVGCPLNCSGMIKYREIDRQIYSEDCEEIFYDFRCTKHPRKHSWRVTEEHSDDSYIYFKKLS